MQVTRGGRRSPSSTGRRGQTIAATVRVLAESGYGRTAFEEFREFDTTLTALTLKSAIDAAIVRMTQPPHLSVDDRVREITTPALLATRRTP
ncbi:MULTISPECIES: hypothetical protein [unclassified Kitasatospora]|uniref:hypothetical protein n=1 Tax=unclassified Kitasatospora TaxID=2633591 RepID=UPI003406B6C0